MLDQLRGVLAIAAIGISVFAVYRTAVSLGLISAGVAKGILAMFVAALIILSAAGSLGLADGM